MTEQEIQRRIKKDLEVKGAYVTKVNPGVFGAVVGHADLVCSILATFPKLDYAIIPICLYIEVKTRTGKVSMMQDIWLRERIKEGHFACVARSTQDVIEYLASQGVII